MVGQGGWHSLSLGMALPPLACPMAGSQTTVWGLKKKENQRQAGLESLCAEGSDTAALGRRQMLRGRKVDTRCGLPCPTAARGTAWLPDTSSSPAPGEHQAAHPASTHRPCSPGLAGLPLSGVGSVFSQLPCSSQPPFPSPAFLSPHLGRPPGTTWRGLCPTTQASLCLLLSPPLP